MRIFRFYCFNEFSVKHSLSLSLSLSLYVVLSPYGRLVITNHITSMIVVSHLSTALIRFNDAHLIGFCGGCILFTFGTSCSLVFPCCVSLLCAALVDWLHLSLSLTRMSIHHPLSSLSVSYCQYFYAFLQLRPLQQSSPITWTFLLFLLCPNRQVRFGTHSWRWPPSSTLRGLPAITTAAAQSTTSPSDWRNARFDAFFSFACRLSSFEEQRRKTSVRW